MLRLGACRQHFNLPLRSHYNAASLQSSRGRIWWNWQTRYFEVVVGQPVQVQVLLCAPVGTLDTIALLRHCPATMKKTRLLLFCLLALNGCAHQYVMTLNNGTKMATASKPTLQHGRYYYKDAHGRDLYVPSGQVRQIEPESFAREEEKQNQFKPTPGVKKKHWYWPF